MTRIEEGIVNSDVEKKLKDIAEVQLHLTESDCVLVRWIDSDIEALKILTHAASDAVPNLTDGNISIPELKYFSEYVDECDPTCGQGIIGIRDEYERKLLEEHSDSGEQEFIKLFSEKAWFPVSVGGHKLLITLLRIESTPYTVPEIDDALFVFECALAKLETNQTDVQHGISAIADWLNSEMCVHYENAAITLAYALASNNGLGWNRVWIFQEGTSDDNSTTWNCHTALGHIRKTDWDQAVKNLEFINDLQEEIDSIPYSYLPKMDELHSRCTGDFVWKVDKEFMECFSPKISSEKEFYPILLHDRALTYKFSTAVREHIGYEYEVGMDSEDENEMAPVWFLQMSLKQEKILIALSDPYTIGQRLSPVTETTAVLRWMQYVLPNWLANGASTGSTDEIQ